MTENFKGIGEMKNIFDMTKERAELENEYTKLGNQMYRLKTERKKISFKIHSTTKKIQGVLTKATGMKFVKPINGEEDGN